MNPMPKNWAEAQTQFDEMLNQNYPVEIVGHLQDTAKVFKTMDQPGYLEEITSWLGGLEVDTAEWGDFPTTTVEES